MLFVKNRFFEQTAHSNLKIAELFERPAQLCERKAPAYRVDFGRYASTQGKNYVNKWPGGGRCPQGATCLAESRRGEGNCQYVGYRHGGQRTVQPRKAPMGPMATPNKEHLAVLRTACMHIFGHTLVWRQNSDTIWLHNLSAISVRCYPIKIAVCIERKKW